MEKHFSPLPRERAVIFPSLPKNNAFKDKQTEKKIPPAALGPILFSKINFGLLAWRGAARDYIYRRDSYRNNRETFFWTKASARLNFQLDN